MAIADRVTITIHVARVFRRPIMQLIYDSQHALRMLGHAPCAVSFISLFR